MAGGKAGLARGFGVALLVGTLASCGAGKPNDRALDTYTAEEIYKRGELTLETTKKPGEALTYFQEVERLYPYSEWAKRALIMQAFTLHKARQYPEARVAAQRFLDFYPGDEDDAYAQYLMALSYYEQIDEVGRDQGLIYQALQAPRAVTDEDADTEYAQTATIKLVL